MAHTNLTQGVGTAWSADGDTHFAPRQSAFAVDVYRTVPAAKARDDNYSASPTLTKAELADLVFEHVGLQKREAKGIVEAFFAEINDALERGESVRLAGFGNFQLRDKAPRPGRNPRTGVQVNIPARRVVTFHASQKLKIVADDSAVPDTPGMAERVEISDHD